MDRQAPVSPGTFAGKTAFASTGAPLRYVTEFEFASGAATIRVPAMSGKVLDPAQRLILYADSDGNTRIQMPSGLWITFHSGLGWLMLSAELADAVAVKLTGNPMGTHWEVNTADGWKRVYYSLDQHSPILSIHGGDGYPDTFSPAIVTPSLAQMRSSKNGVNSDLQKVDLRQETLDEIDFTKAQFSFANLEGATFKKATLTDAMFVEATLRTIYCDGAVLDGADMTRAQLDGTSWGSPASARGIVLTGCKARDAILGGQTKALDCTKANLAGGDFSGANLKGWLLNNAEASGAILTGCNLDGGILDGAKLVNAIAVGSSMIGASLRAVNAQGALLIRANLTNADLTRARMGAKAWLFAIAGSFAADLDTKKFVQPSLIAAFKQQGVTLNPSAAVSIVELGRRWTILDPAGPYALSMDAAAKIDVFSASPDLRPATLRGAICRGTRASGASLAGADLRGIQWYSKPATLDHADLESAVLSGSLLVQTDFTQAYLAGADLSSCILVQAGFKGCRLGAGESRRAFSLEGAQLEETNFEEATLSGALLTDAAVAVSRGVPLFRLPKADEGFLNAGDLAKLASAFEKAGYPLGSGAKLSESKTWLLDNHADQNPSAPRVYRVRLISTVLQVYNSDTGSPLFKLAPGFEEFLSSASAGQELVAAFAQSGYSLVLGAPIAIEAYWQIEVGADALGKSAVSFPILRVHTEPAYLPVYASTRVLLRDWPQYAAGIAFSATSAIESAMNPASICPSGFPRSWVDTGRLDWETLLTIKR
jgi:uncharacterized protein YjbI with pentapeptide repeats